MGEGEGEREREGARARAKSDGEVDLCALLQGYLACKKTTRARPTTFARPLFSCLETFLGVPSLKAQHSALAEPSGNS